MLPITTALQWADFGLHRYEVLFPIWAAADSREDYTCAAAHNVRVLHDLAVAKVDNACLGSKGVKYHLTERISLMRVWKSGVEDPA